MADTAKEMNTGITNTDHILSTVCVGSTFLARALAVGMVLVLVVGAAVALDWVILVVPALVVVAMVRGHEWTKRIPEGGPRRTAAVGWEHSPATPHQLAYIRDLWDRAYIPSWARVDMSKGPVSTLQTVDVPSLSVGCRWD